MNDLTAVRERFQQDDLPTRLGGLAANLARVSSFSKNVNNKDAVYGLLEESKYFIEWSAGEADAERAADLVELQVQLSRWQYHWPSLWDDSTRRENLTTQARLWSDRVLQASGILDT
ncbi:MAG: hypothetical protein HP497_01305 [Nitrospira sp.]|nr:hypothetical protein [Nitrospira sp.]